jgi:hypothetical protein
MYACVAPYTLTEQRSLPMFDARLFAPGNVSPVCVFYYFKLILTRSPHTLHLTYFNAPSKLSTVKGKSQPFTINWGY